MKTELRLEGLSCQHCISALKKAFSKESRIKNAEVELKQALIEHDDTISPEEIIKIIEEEGYKAEVKV